jgi:hypothetical protein
VRTPRVASTALSRTDEPKQNAYTTKDTRASDQFHKLINFWLNQAIHAIYVNSQLKSEQQG